MSKPITCRRSSRLNIPKDVDPVAARRWVRRQTAEGCRLHDMKGKSKRGDPLNYKINGFLRALQIEILEIEGWPSAELRQEAQYVLKASKPEDSSEMRANCFTSSQVAHLLVSSSAKTKRLDLISAFVPSRSHSHQRERHTI